MATRALQQIVTYLAWNTSTNAYVTGDSANHSTSWCKDGTRAATTNATAEVDATNLPGLYKVTMTSTETDCIEAVLGGKSTTANVVLIPTMVAFDYLNTSAPATAGIPDVNAKNFGNTAVTGRDIGASVLLSSGTGTGQLSLSAGTVTVGTNNDKTGYSLTQAFPTNFSSLAIDVSGRVDLGKALGTAVTLDANNVLNVSAKYVGGTLQTARDLGASVLLSSGTGTGQLSLSSGTVTVGTNNDKTGYTLTQTFPTNFATLAIDGSGRVDLGKVVGDATAATIFKTGLNTVATGTIGAGSTTTSIVSSALSPNGTASGQFNGRIMIFSDGTSTAALQGQATSISASTASATPTFTVTALTTAPSAGDTFIIV